MLLWWCVVKIRLYFPQVLTFLRGRASGPFLVSGVPPNPPFGLLSIRISSSGTKLRVMVLSAIVIMSRLLNSALSGIFVPCEASVVHQFLKQQLIIYLDRSPRNLIAIRRVTWKQRKVYHLLIISCKLRIIIQEHIMFTLNILPGKFTSCTSIDPVQLESERLNNKSFPFKHRIVISFK